MTIGFSQIFINLMSLIRNKQNKGNGNIKIKLLYLKYISRDFYLLLTLTFFKCIRFSINFFFSMLRELHNFFLLILTQFKRRKASC